MISQKYKSMLSRLMILALLNGTTANAMKSLDEQENEFFSTQTGSYLKHMFPLQKPETAVKSAIDRVVTKYRDQITGFDYNNKNEEINNLYNRISPLLQNEIDRKQTDYVFYHGHSNSLSLYIDVLHDFMEATEMKKLENTHPMRLKSKNAPISNVRDFLDHFTQKYIEHAKRNQFEPYAPKRNSGFASAPDLIDYARENLVCANASLFGNTENAFESTFFYFLNSFNIGNPNDALIRDLLINTGLAASDPEALQEQMDSYKGIFMKKMNTAGGGLMQIFIKRDRIDDYGYASWAKGVPYYMHKKTNTFATRRNNLKSVAILENETSSFYRPRLSSMLDLYKKDLYQFSSRYSYNDASLFSADRFQVRLLVQPSFYMDENQVTIYRTFRNDVNVEDTNTYKKEIREKIRDDFSRAISEKKLTPSFFDYDFALGKFVGFLWGKGLRQVWDVADIIRNSTREALSDTLELLRNAISKSATITKTMIKRFSMLEIFASIKELSGKAGHVSERFLKRVIRQLHG